MPAPTELLDLVARFREQHADYQRGAYNETQLRRDFLDPLFTLLGWDVDNRGGYAESFREVVHEDAVKVGGMTKAPDYSFRIGGRRLFFLEAKKPAVYIKEDIAPAYQLRRYAWSAGLQLSILSDFEEFAVYDGSIKPAPKDKSSKARIFYCTYEDYADKWDEIAALFSKDAVLKGGIERFVKKLPGRRGTATVDAEFLAQIEHWRDLLARNIALRNDGIEVQALNHAVQATIDRIVFLRICEDRGIEHEGRLLALTNGAGIYARLTRLFRDADDRYNSGLFHFRAEKGRAGEPDAYTLKLAIDDKPLKDIIRGLYYPESPYEFAVLPADILGQVYERFLGKVIRLTTGGQAKVEEKPEVKKAGGVYYTPTYIVEYIVRQTVGTLLEGKTPKQAEKLRICDPACGSGSFLIGAYQHLLDWHLKWYAENEPQKHASGKNPKLRQSHDGWRLTVAERKRILINNIYGVDIDAQAVEVTKLSLLLKVLEGETGETLGLAQMRLFHERALPNLDANILCGNSLIGTDFYDGRLDLDEDERRRINAFDWESGFPEVFKAGGFDAVIGNPPYIRIQTLKEWAPLEVEHYKVVYRAASKGNYDIYAVFVERGLQLLNKQGRLGFILPHKFFNAEYGEPLRGLIADGRHLANVVHFGHQQVFGQATTYTCLLFLNRAATDTCRFTRVHDLDAFAAGGLDDDAHDTPAQRITASPWNFAEGEAGKLFERLMAMPKKLGDFAHIFVGLQTSADKVYVLEGIGPAKSGKLPVRDAEGNEWKLETGILKPFLSKVSLQSHARPQAGHWLLFPYDIDGGKAELIPPEAMARRYPEAWRYVQSKSPQLKKREGGKWNHATWHGYIYKKNLTAFEAAKLVVQVISLRGRYAFDDAGSYFTGGGNGPYYGVRWKTPNDPHSLLYLSGLLNSRLLDSCLHRISTPFRGGYWSYGKRFIEHLPTRVIDFSDPADCTRHDKMVKLVESMLKLHEQLAAAKTAHNKILIQRQMDATDRQIDALVYELYGLADDEIRIIEAGKAPG
ncbi:MAG: N-6 DNA methylase [Pseudomonadota bacterium]